ncbi:TetR/AcrR family transcriptional regulator C-terminal domain-containing protein [Kitasatospora sp. CM 4170]|uniref:TetR/AcrR family transcriptional regulator n=1 Tax=Kitasatospora aburaviensis TaxID=67265 RepID=A0ABW1FBN0_9ACTN|nr:TetR/AcrR family transcriptional regulator C-terminal domain-containing protein [Kitasatospora sp. CM 4170]WNM49375.1 TetR/AcrR family transcriptional regulator C-terminal domain-containing protein [Kitasatospora sp. CM 4170]
MAEGTRRTPLSRERVLRAAVALADGSGAGGGAGGSGGAGGDGAVGGSAGVEALSMRKLAQELGVVPMALYKHVANKEELLAGMVDAVVGEIDPPAPGADWKDVVRQRVLSARRVLRHHPWAPRVIESLPAPTPAMLDHLDSVIGTFRSGGLSADLTHHAMHALGGRVLGFSQELFDASPPGGTPAGQTAPEAAAQAAELAARYPYIAEIAASAVHTDGSVISGGCDDQFEFEFALDLLLDGIDRLHRRGWTSSAHRGGPSAAPAGG